jgi:hypothetical protein
MSVSSSGAKVNKVPEWQAQPEAVVVEAVAEVGAPRLLAQLQLEVLRQQTDG